MKIQNPQPLQLLQPYLPLRTNGYQRMIENNYGISHFYEFQVQSSKKCDLQAVPDGSVDLLFAINEKQVHALIGGTVLQAKAWKLPEDSLYFGIRFFPGQCILPADLKIEEIIDADIDISDEPFIRKLSKQLMETRTAKERSALFRKYYQKEFLGNNDKSASAMLEPYIRKRIYETRGTIRMKELAEESGYSSCYIRRIFSGIHGVAPKTFEKFVRFQHLLGYLTNQIQSSEAICLDMGEIALEYGYSDQPHMIHEFKNCTGITPEAYMHLVSMCLRNSTSTKH